MRQRTDIPPIVPQWAWHACHLLRKMENHCRGGGENLFNVDHGSGHHYAVKDLEQLGHVETEPWSEDGYSLTHHLVRLTDPPAAKPNCGPKWHGVHRLPHPPVPAGGAVYGRPR